MTGQVKCCGCGRPVGMTHRISTLESASTVGIKCLDCIRKDRAEMTPEYRAAVDIISHHMRFSTTRVELRKFLENLPRKEEDGNEDESDI